MRLRCGWRSLLCALDTIGHRIGWSPRWICDRHDKALLRGTDPVA